LGEALAPYRGKVVIATKFGFDLRPDLDPHSLGCWRKGLGLFRSRYDEDKPPGRKHRSGVDPTDAREPAEIDAAAPKIKVQGDRYPERLEKMTGL
jgi:hypothetical protein